MKSRFVFSIIIVVLIIVLGIGCLAPARSSENSSCVKCHTDEQIMKNLYKPPIIDNSEGEG